MKKIKQEEPKDTAVEPSRFLTEAQMLSLELNATKCALANQQFENKLHEIARLELMAENAALKAKLAKSTQLPDLQDNYNSAKKTKTDYLLHVKEVHSIKSDTFGYNPDTGLISEKE